MGSRSLARLKMACVLFSLGLILTTRRFNLTLLVYLSQISTRLDQPRFFLTAGTRMDGGTDKTLPPSSLRSETSTSSRSTGATWRAGSPIRRQRSEQLRWADTLQGWCN